MGNACRDEENISLTRFNRFISDDDFCPPAKNILLMLYRVGVQGHMTSCIDSEIAHGEVGGFVGGEEHFHCYPFARFLRHCFNRVDFFL